MGKNGRPTGLAIIAILQVVVGIFAFAYAFIFHFSAVQDGGVAVLEIFAKFGLMIAGAFFWVLGYGIWKGWQWTWGAIIGLSVLGIVIGLIIIGKVVSVLSVTSLNNYAFILSGTIPVIIVCSIYLWYFSRKRTRNYFGEK